MKGEIKQRMSTKMISIWKSMSEWYGLKELQLIYTDDV